MVGFSQKTKMGFSWLGSSWGEIYFFTKMTTSAFLNIFQICVLQSKRQTHSVCQWSRIRKRKHHWFNAVSSTDRPSRYCLWYDGSHGQLVLGYCSVCRSFSKKKKKKPKEGRWNWSVLFWKALQIPCAISRVLEKLCRCSLFLAPVPCRAETLVGPSFCVWEVGPTQGFTAISLFQLLERSLDGSVPDPEPRIICFCWSKTENLLRLLQTWVDLHDEPSVLLLKDVLGPMWGVFPKGQRTVVFPISEEKERHWTHLWWGPELCLCDARSMTEHSSTETPSTDP